MNGRKQTYRVASPLKVLTPAILTLAFTFGLVFVVTKPDERAFIPYFGLLLVAVIGIVYVIMMQTRLEVSSDGITYFSIGYKVASTWGNVAGYGKRTMGSQDVDVLILREPGMDMSLWMRIGYMLYPVGQLAALAQGRTLISNVNLDDYSVWIPVGMYAENWRESELGDFVKRYAPSAFETAL